MNPRNHHPVIDAAEWLRVLAGFWFSGYRSFGAPGESAQVGPLGTIHLLVGKNNSGKSNVLRFVSDVLTKFPSFDVEASFAEVFPHPLDVNANGDGIIWFGRP